MITDTALRTALMLTIVAPIGGSCIAATTDPTALSDLLNCQSLTDEKARLACYDVKVGALAKARAQDDIIVMDRAEVHRVRRSLFGLTLPSFDIFGGRAKPSKAAGGEDIDRITDTIASATQGQYGRWTFILSDGTRWTQTDDITLNIDPRSGTAIVIRRAAMGSYLANVGGQIAIRVHRLN